MYDAWCMAEYGVDSHLIKNPVYLQGFVGQGQSVLYPIVGGAFLKVLGYQIYAYRLPLILICVLHSLVLLHVSIKYADSHKAFWNVLAVASSPYLLTLTRFGMDCNIAPFLCSIGSMLLFAGCMEKESRKKNLLMVAGSLFVGLTAYSYNVAWIFLPVYLLSLLIGMLLLNRVRIREVMLPATVMLVEMIPIIIFAVRSNISELNQTIRILWWTSPRLPIGRAEASFINFHENIFVNIFQNLKIGLAMFVRGTDNLSWNSVGRFGPYYMFALFALLPGMYVVIKRRSTGDIFIISQIIGMIPIVLLVTPNYNHWIFLHIPVLLMIAAGFDKFEKVCIENKYRIFSNICILIYAVSFLWYSNLYFSPVRYTGWDSNVGQILSQLDTNQYDKVYFSSSESEFIWIVRFALPISPYDFQATKDNPFSEENLGTNDHYGNFERITAETVCEDNALFIIQDDDVEALADFISGKTEKPVIKFNGITYHVFS